MAYPEYRLPFEELTTIDERVDYVHTQVTQVQLALNRLLEKEGLPPMAVVTKEVRLQQTLAPLQGVKVRDFSPLTGRIVQVIPHFPDGCNALVDLAFGRSDAWVIPGQVDTFIALNDATPVLQVEEPVFKGEELWMVARNGDAVNPHSVSILITIIGER